MSMRDKQPDKAKGKLGSTGRPTEGPRTTPATDMQLEDADVQGSGTASGGKDEHKSVSSSMKQTSKTEREKGSRR